MLTPIQQQLIQAINTLDVSAVQLILESGESPNFMDEQGQPPLHVLTDKVYEWWDVILAAYEAEQPLSQADKDTTFEPYMAIFDLLIDHGANVHLWDSNEFFGPLWDVASAGAVPMVKKLLELGVNPNTKDSTGLTVLSSISDLLFDQNYDDSLLAHCLPEEVAIFQLLVQYGGEISDVTEKE